MLHDNLEEWDGEGGGREVQKGGDICISMLDSCLTVCGPIGCSPSGASVHGILQARILKWIAMPSSRDLPGPEIETTSLNSPALAGGLFTASATWETPPIGYYWAYTLRKP